MFIGRSVVVQPPSLVGIMTAPEVRGVHTDDDTAALWTAYFHCLPKTTIPLGVVVTSSPPSNALKGSGEVSM